MDPDSNIITYVLVIIALVFVSALFSSSEIAILNLSSSKVKKLHKGGNKRAGAILRLTGDPPRFLATIQTGTTVTVMLAAALTARRIAPLAPLPDIAPVWQSALFIAFFAAATLLLAFLMLLLGQTLPKRVAVHYPERVAFALVPLLSFLSALEKPFTLLLGRTSDIMVRFFGIDPNSDPELVTEEEILMMVGEGNEKGTIEQSEKDMIENIFDFDDRTVDAVMTHRTAIIALEAGSHARDAVKAAVQNGCSRIPVYDEDIDNIIGIVYIKDLLILFDQDGAGEKLIDGYMRKPLYVPSSTRCVALFGEFKKQKLHMAVVIDEYGGTAGIVTMEDLLESIVGNIQDEYDDEEAEALEMADGSYELDGAISLGEIERLFDIKLPEDQEYDTLAGLLTDALGRIPEEGEQPSVVMHGVRFTVLKVEDRHISKASAEPVAAKGARPAPKAE